MSGDLINATEAWKSYLGKMFLRVSAVFDETALDQLFSSNKKITIISVANAGDKQTHIFQENVRQIIIRCEKVTTIKYNFDETDYDANKKATITSGGQLKLTGLKWEASSIFFDTDKNNMDIEITELY